MTLHTGDCLDVMPTLAAGSVDAVVTDPPYGLEFMGKAWDTDRHFWLVETATLPTGRSASTEAQPTVSPPSPLPHGDRARCGPVVRCARCLRWGRE